MLYYKIKNAIIDYQVVHHAKTEWLGQQHLDIYFPELNIAIEYQGTQHQKPVDFFGGQEGFEKGKERDLRKKNLCIENGCTLFYVYPEDDTDMFIEKLKKIVYKKK